MARVAPHPIRRAATQPMIPERALNTMVHHLDAHEPLVPMTGHACLAAVIGQITANRAMTADRWGNQRQDARYTPPQHRIVHGDRP